MNVYYTEELPRGAFLREAFAREGVHLSEAEISALPRTKSGKPFLPRGELRFSLTHADSFLAVAVGKEEVGLDAEKKDRRPTEALLLRMTASERREDFSLLWTAKEAYVKYRGGTLAQLLPHLVYGDGALRLDGAPVPESLRHIALGEYTLCLCTRGDVPFRTVRL